MTPYEQARAVYQKEWCAKLFEEDLEHYLRHGFVVSLPDIFAMVKQEGDTWVIGLLAGDLRKAFDYLPFYLPYIRFERRNKPKIYATVSLTNRILSRDRIKV